MNATPDTYHLIQNSSQNEREATYHACWVVALCDGRLWREKQLLLNIAAELRLDKKTARGIEKKARNGKRDFDEPTTDAGRRVMYHFTLKVAASDGKLSDAERQHAYQCGRHFGLGTDEIDVELSSLIPEKYRPRVRRTTHSKRRALQKLRTDVVEKVPTWTRMLVEGMRSDAIQAGTLHQFSTYVLPFLLMLGAHLVPVFGALFWEWDVPTILLIYWCETVIMGIFTAFKLALSLPGKIPVPGIGNTGFFCLHYGLFTLIHGFVVLGITLGMVEEGSSPHLTNWLGAHFLGILLAVATIAIEHSVFFYTDSLREEQYKRTTQDDHFWRPYPRIVAIHLTVLFGGFAMLQLGWTRAIPVMIMIGLHLSIETAIWVHQLPLQGFLGGIRKIIQGGLVGVVMALFPWIFIAVFGHILLSFVAIVLVLIFPDSEWFAKAIASPSYFLRVGSVIGLTIVFSGLTGMIIGGLDHLKIFDSDRLAPHHVFLFVLVLLALAAALTAIIPFDQIVEQLFSEPA